MNLRSTDSQEREYGLAYLSIEKRPDSDNRNTFYDSSNCFPAEVGYKKVRVSREIDREWSFEEDVEDASFSGK